jgi:transposase-like protein
MLRFAVTVGKMQHPRIKLDAPAQRRALRVIESGGTVAEAARAAGCSPRTIQWRRQNDPAFAEAYEAARQRLVDALEREAIKRATEGVWETTVHPDGTETRKLRVSDRLLELLLKRHDPGYTDRVQVEATSTHRVEFAMLSARMSELPTSTKRELLALLDRIEKVGYTGLTRDEQERFDELDARLSGPKRIEVVE